MQGEWCEVQLGDVVDLLTGYPLKSEHYSTDPDDPRIIGGDNIAQGSLRWNAVRRWPKSMTSDLDDYWLKKGDVVLAMDRPWIDAGLKRAAVDRNDLPALLIQRTARLRGTSVLDAGFLRYLIASRDFTNYVTGIQTGTAIPHISAKQIKGFRFLLPPIPEQRAIAHILGTLDDKIELNRRMNETLEAMARALFQSWFVDFDPVRAKAGGRQPPGMDPATAAPFPSKLQDSALGRIPKGWRLCKLGDVMELKRGYDLPTASRRPGHVPIVSSSGPSGWHDEVKATGPGIVTGRYGTVGQVFLIREDFWPLNTTLYLRDFKSNDLLYCYHLLCLVEFSKFSDKAAVPGINRYHLHEEPVVAAPIEVQERFAKLAGDWLELAARNTAQATTLAEMRDALLPRLLSGELSVSKAMKSVESMA